MSLEKPPGRRYACAAALADDLRHFLADEPIHARRVGRPERLWRWCRRQPVVAALVAAIGLSLLLGTAVSSHFAIRATAQRKRADANAAKAEANATRAVVKAEEADRHRREAEQQYQRSNLNLYYARIALADQKWLSNEVGEAERLLDACPSGLRHWEWRYLKKRCHLDAVTLSGHADLVSTVAFDADGKRLASGSWDGAVKIWDATDGRVLHNLQPRGRSIGRLAFSPDGKRGESLLTLRGHGGAVWGVAFSPDGNRLASGSKDLTVKIWETPDRPEPFAFRGDG